MVAVVVQHQFDDAGAVIEIRSHRLAYLRRAVGVEVLVLPECALLRRNAVRLAAERCDDLAAGDDRRALVPPGIDRPPHVVHGVVTGISDVTHRREAGGERSEEHTSELQSHVNLVCRLLLEKKKKKNNLSYSITKKKKNKK